MNFIAGLDTRPQAEIRSVQLELLREQVRYALVRSPFYRERLAGVDVDSLSMDDLSGCSLTSKEDIQRENRAFLCVEDKEIAEVVATTGTTGEHVWVYLTKNDLVRLAENERRCFTYAGIGAGDLILFVRNAGQSFHCRACVLHGASTAWRGRNKAWASQSEKAP